MTLDNPSSNFKIELERFVFETFDKDYNVNNMLIEVSDQGNVAMSKSSRDGFLDGFFPRKYLKNMQEPFTQNRIMYDIKLYENEQYASPLRLEDVYVPNELNFSNDIESKKLFKFLATHEMSTDAEYSGYVIYPALKAQRNYELSDSIDSDFSYVDEIEVEYLGDVCSISAPLGSSYDIGYQTAGCSFLGIGVTDEADWLKVRFKVRTPSLDMFMTNNWTSQQYTMPAAQLSLVS
jgi:hypothetical protein